MKKLILIFLFIFSFASNLSTINPNWAVMDCVNNYELIQKHKYLKYLKILKESDKVLSLKNSFVDPKIYDKLFKSGVWDKMIEKVEFLYKKENNELLKKIIFYMKKIKKEVKRKDFAIA